MSFIRSIIVFGSALLLCLSMQVAIAQSVPASTLATDSTSHAAVEKKVNINSATAEQLKKVKGIGAAKAKAIVDYRTEHGPFKSVDGLTEVKGFSTKVVANLVKKNPGVMAVD